MNAPFVLCVPVIRSISYKFCVTKTRRIPSSRLKMNMLQSSQSRIGRRGFASQLCVTPLSYPSSPARAAPRRTPRPGAVARGILHQCRSKSQHRAQPRDSPRDRSDLRQAVAEFLDMTSVASA